MPDISEMLTITQASKLAKISRQAVWVALTQSPPRIKGKMVHGRWYIDRKEILKRWGFKVDDHQNGK